MRRFLSAFLFCLLSCFRVFGQEPAFEHFTVDDGLAGLTVYCAFQDSEGFMWFGTRSGVSRYDGHHFENFNTLNGLSDNEVFFIKEDSRGRIWFHTYNGRLSYYQNGKLHNRVNTPFLDFSTNNAFSNTFVEDQSGNLYFPAISGILEVTAEDSILLHPTSMVIYDLWLNKEDQLFALMNPTTIVKLDDAFNSTLLFAKPNPPRGVVGRDLINDSLWLINYNDKLYLMNSTTEEVFSQNSPSITEKAINTFNVIHNEIWTNTNQGAIRQRLDDRDFYEKFLVRYRPTWVLKDREGNYWFSTLYNGVFFTPTIEVRTFDLHSGLPDAPCLNVAVTPDSVIWTGYTNGEYSQIKMDGIGNYIQVSDYEGMGRQFYALIPYSHNEMLLFTNGGISLASGDQQKTLIKTNVKDGAIDQQGNIWMTSSSFVGLLPKNKADWDNSRYGYHGRVPAIQIRETRSFAVECANDGKVWFSDKLGLHYFVHADDSCYDSPWSEQLSSQRITHLQFTSQDHLWMSSDGGGLFIAINDSLHQITETEGLLSNGCRRIAMENDHNIWIANTRGVSKIEVSSYAPLEYNIKNFTRSNGLASNDVHDIATFNGTIYAATSQGLTVFKEESLRPDTFSPIVKFEKLYVNEQPYELTSTIDLPADSSWITIAFTSPVFRTMGASNYRYRLLGADIRWQYISENTINFPSLTPNTYQLEVQAANSSGQWGEATVLEIVIAPPFTQTWLFRILIIVAIILLLSGIFYLRVRNIRKKARHENELQRRFADLKLEALRSQMNPHFIFNCLNTIQGFVNKGMEDEANIYLSKFATILRMTLENSRKSGISLQDELDALELYLELESLRFSHKFSYHINKSDKISAWDLELPGMLIQPYVENAIKHGLSQADHDGELNIDLELEDNHLLITITDNGIGRKKAEEMKKGKKGHISRGMDITSERLTILHKLYGEEMQVHISDLTNEAGEAIGTKVSLTVPVSFY